MPFGSHSGISSGFFIVRDSVWATTFCVDVKIFSHKLGGFSSTQEFHFWDFFRENSTSFHLMSSHFCCSVSFILSSSFLILYLLSSSILFIVFFFIAPDFFPKLLNFFYRRRLFHFNGLFSDPLVEFLHISHEYFILPVAFRPFFKSSNSFCLDHYSQFYSLFCPYHILIL